MHGSSGKQNIDMEVLKYNLSKRLFACIVIALK